MQGKQQGAEVTDALLVPAKVKHLDRGTFSTLYVTRGCETMVYFLLVPLPRSPTATCPHPAKATILATHSTTILGSLGSLDVYRFTNAGYFLLRLALAPVVSGLGQFGKGGP